MGNEQGKQAVAPTAEAALSSSHEAPSRASVQDAGVRTIRAHDGALAHDPAASNNLDDGRATPAPSPSASPVGTSLSHHAGVAGSGGSHAPSQSPHGAAGVTPYHKAKARGNAAATATDADAASNQSDAAAPVDSGRLVSTPDSGGHHGASFLVPGRSAKAGASTGSSPAAARSNAGGTPWAGLGIAVGTDSSGGRSRTGSPVGSAPSSRAERNATSSPFTSPSTVVALPRITGSAKATLSSSTLDRKRLDALLGSDDASEADGSASLSSDGYDAAEDSGIDNDWTRARPRVRAKKPRGGNLRDGTAAGNSGRSGDRFARAGEAKGAQQQLARSPGQQLLATFSAASLGADADDEGGDATQMVFAPSVRLPPQRSSARASRDREEFGEFA